MTGPGLLLSGTFANRYAIERELGRGGTAVVYLARDLQRGHQVAVKVLRPELQESLAADRFLREMRLSQQLHHPNVVPVLDAGDHDGRLYFVHPFMEGGTLRGRMQREGQLPLAEVVAITQSVGAALAYAHAQGVVHRDVKPENILFTSGQACLSDFGIARALERSVDDSMTSTSVVRGTPSYMSPEQASGERDLDGRSDLYALACVAYEMIAGIQPFVGPTPESIIAQRLTHPPRPIRVYRATIPAGVEAVLERALAIARADRFQSVAEFTEELAKASRLEDTAATRAPYPRRRLTPWALGGAVVAALLLVWVVTRRADDARTTQGTPTDDPRRIAVMYLEDRTPDSLPQHIADGISEDLIDQLGSVRALHVISPYGVRPFRNGTASLDSISKVLQVGTLVTGNIARSGNTVRINVRFLDARNGQQLASRTLQQPWSEVFALQDQLAEQVAFFLRQQLGEQIALTEQQRQTRSYAAWELVQMAAAEHLRAIDASTARGGLTSVQLLLRADSLYARAHVLDPSWAVPTVRRGAIANAMATQPGTARTLPPPGVDSARYAALPDSARIAAWLNSALVFANSALARSPGSAEALTLRGVTRLRMLTLLNAGDTLVPQIEHDLRAAIDSRPEAAEPWANLARLWVTQGRFPDASAAAQRAVDADAFFEVRALTAIAFLAALHAEQFDVAAKWCRMGLERYPGDPRFGDCELTLLGWTGTTRASADQAWSVLNGIEQRDSLGMLKPTWAYRRLLVAAVLARAGLRDSSRRVLQLVQEQHRRDPGVRIVPIGEAYVHLLLGDRDAAIAALTRHLQESPNARRQLAEHPWFRPLRGDPRFQSLVQRGG